MILATMGTHPAAMDRLVHALDDLAANGEDIGIQMARYKVLPKVARIIPLASPEEHRAQLLKAQDIICHGAPATIFFILKTTGKIPLIIPRQHRYGEHVDDHQVYFMKYLNHLYGLPFVMDMKDLPACLIANRSLRIDIQLPDSLHTLCDRLNQYGHGMNLTRSKES
jgi:UDP-N-acetylglucosamine transferase subunit ALG13